MNCRLRPTLLGVVWDSPCSSCLSNPRSSLPGHTGHRTCWWWPPEHTHTLRSLPACPTTRPLFVRSLCPDALPTLHLQPQPGHVLQEAFSKPQGCSSPLCVLLWFLDLILSLQSPHDVTPTCIHLCLRHYMASLWGLKIVSFFHHCSPKVQQRVWHITCINKC